MKKLPTITEEQRLRINALLNEAASVDRALQGAMDAAANRHIAISASLKSWWDGIASKEQLVGIHYNPGTGQLERTTERAPLTVPKR